MIIYVWKWQVFPVLLCCMTSIASLELLIRFFFCPWRYQIEAKFVSRQIFQRWRWRRARWLPSLVSWWSSWWTQWWCWWSLSWWWQWWLQLWQWQWHWQSSFEGGTGKTGKFGVKGALQRGHNVRLLARNPDKVGRSFFWFKFPLYWVSLRNFVHSLFCFRLRRCSTTYLERRKGLCSLKRFSTVNVINDHLKYQVLYTLICSRWRW